MTSLNQILVLATSTGLTTSSTAYSSGDTMGAEMQWDMGTNTYGLVLGGQFVDAADITGAVTLYLFDRSVTFGTDNVAPSISDADALFTLGAILFPTPADLGGVRMSTIDSLAVPVKANASGIIYGRLVTETGHTFFGAVGNIQVGLHFSLDV